MALSLGGLRRKIEALLLPNDVRVVLQPTARRAGAAPSAGVGAAKQNPQVDQRTALRTKVCIGGSGRAFPKEEVRV